MSVSVLATIFEHVNRGGDALLLAVGDSQRYHAFPAADLQWMDMYRRISSTSLFGAAGADPILIFVDTNPFGHHDFGGFSGRFLQLANSGSGERVVNLTDHAFNETTSSLLMVAGARGNEFRVSMRDAFVDKWREILDGQLAGTEASRNGDPVMTWEMFPQAISHLNPSLMYLKIHQNLDVELDWWPDYEASIAYHVFLHVTGGNLRGWVQRWAYWIEGGAKSDDIAEVLEPKVVAGMDRLNDELNSQLSSFDGFGIDDLYYLPGRQLSATDTKAGWTADDVTIVLQI